MTASSAATSPSVPAVASIRTTALTLASAAVVAYAVTWIVALAALAAGADPAFAPLVPYVFGTFAVGGVLAGHLGWRLVRGLVPRPRAVLRVLVPVAVLLSLIPDVVLLLTGFIPGTTTTGVVALMLMHPIVATIAVAVSQRLAPVR